MLSLSRGCACVPTVRRSNKSVIKSLFLCLCLSAGCQIAYPVSPVLAKTFSPDNLDELKSAVAEASSNRQEDVIDLGEHTFVLTDELRIGADGGHGIVVKNGTLERSESAAFFRLLRLDSISQAPDALNEPALIENVEFRNGYYIDPQSGDELSGGGALLTDRVTRIKDSKFLNNHAVGDVAGGAIKHSAELEIATSFFANNKATVIDSQQATHGGAIASRSGASLFVSHTYFLGNYADAGGAIHVASGVSTVNITRSAFDGNAALTHGGAIWSVLADGDMRISNTSFIANHAPAGGGGLYAQALFARIILLHLTFWGNEADEGAGGGIRALIPSSGSTIELRNSVITNNVGGNCMNTQGTEFSFRISEYNLSDDDSCGSDGLVVLPGAASVFAGKFDHYGGLIPSLPILASSPASNFVPRDHCLGFDARDVARLDNLDVADVYCDAGAFEYVPIQHIDIDGDAVRDRQDNCVDASNPLQSDIDNDGIGDSCDTRDDRDTDLDAIVNFSDNCPEVQNFFQLDLDGNGIGDACEEPGESFVSVVRKNQ